MLVVCGGFTLMLVVMPGRLRQAAVRTKSMLYPLVTGARVLGMPLSLSSKLIDWPGCRVLSPALLNRLMLKHPDPLAPHAWLNPESG